MKMLIKAGRTCLSSAVFAGLALILASCKTPFSDKLTQIDWTGAPLAGTISVSQPKMYRRESLINERRLDAEWIGGLFRDFSKVEFQPEMVRELEQITTFAAALGLNFDPARGAEYRRESETDAIRHEIDVVKLRLQLDQLTRDAELLRSRFAAQTEPSAPKPGDGDKGGTPGAGNDTPPPPASQAQMEAAIVQLKAAIDRFSQNLGTRLDATAADIKSAQGTVSPGDKFRDQLALRDLWKAALNSASLDDLHDFNGSALIRLNFQAMALPRQEGMRAPGVIQMTIRPPPDNAPEWDSLYRNWLDHINGRLNRLTDKGWEQDPELTALADSDLFTLIAFYFPRAGGAVASGIGSGADCAGYAVRSTERDAHCDKLEFAVPRFIGGSDQEGAYSTLEDYLGDFAPYPNAQAERAATSEIHGKILASAGRLVKDCGAPIEISLRTPTVDAAQFDAADVLHALRRARVRVVAGDEIARVERAVRRSLGPRAAPMVHGSATSRLYATQTAQARFLLRTFENVAYRRCPLARRMAFRNALPKLYLPPRFDELLREAPRIAVYEIGPRELVQRISSVSRIANNLSLALSLAAAAPRTGLGASAASNYSRQAIGKAATFERIPSLIGYAEGGNAGAGNTFGWVLMPRAAFDPRGDIELEQGPRTMDLAVDLSLPVWWPYFELATATGWGESAGGGAALRQSAPTRVPMRPNYADFEQLTVKLQRDAQSQVRFDDPTFKGQSVDACRTTTLYVRGAQLWRASAAVIGGHRLPDSALVVAPDMSGVLLTVPALAGLVRTNDGAPPLLSLSVFTRDGEAAGTVGYAVPPQSGCPPAPKTAAAPVAPATPAAPAAPAVP